jgi:TPP-dependent pyruvate/acetoin dehydrogenase alpha subunit
MSRVTGRRRTKTPRERAQEQYDTANRIARRLANKLATAEAEVNELREQHADAVRRADFLAQHPDLAPDTEDDPLPDPDDDGAA